MSRTELRGDQIADGTVQAIDCDDTIEKTIRKGAAGGYAPLDTTALVPALNLGTGEVDITTVLRGDQTWGLAAAMGIGLSHRKPQKNTIIQTNYSAVVLSDFEIVEPFMLDIWDDGLFEIM